MKLLTVHDVMILHMQIIDASGGAQGVRDIERLTGTIEQVVQDVFGKELYPSIYEKAAALTFGIINYHPFIDGNKRTGVMSALLFLNLNGHDTSLVKNKELEDFAVNVAVDKLDVATIADWLQARSSILKV